jgi:hypothetical protein
MSLLALDPFWNDLYAVAGVVIGLLGLLVGLLGFGYTIYQVRKTKAAAQAAEEAASRVLDESRHSFRRLVAASAHRYLVEARRRVHDEEWQLAALRAEDLADQLSQLHGEDPELGSVVDAVRELAQVMMEKSKVPTRKFAQKRWNELAQVVQRKVDRLQQLFAGAAEGSHDISRP